MLKRRKRKEIKEVRFKTGTGLHKDVKALARKRGMKISGMYKEIVATGVKVLGEIREGNIVTVQRGKKGK